MRTKNTGFTTVCSSVDSLQKYVMNAGKESGQLPSSCKSTNTSLPNFTFVLPEPQSGDADIMQTMLTSHVYKTQVGSFSSASKCRKSRE